MLRRVVFVDLPILVLSSQELKVVSRLPQILWSVTVVYHVAEELRIVLQLDRSFSLYFDVTSFVF